MATVHNLPPCEVLVWYNTRVSGYTLQTEVFEGPLELLLALIEKRKLLINDIALSDVADDYLTYVERHQEFPLAETARFVLVGSTLLLIKSKSLLPQLSLTHEEQESVEDLSHRLKLLDCFKRVAHTLESVYGSRKLYSRQRSRSAKVLFAPDEHTTVEDLAIAMRDVLQHLPQPQPSLPQATVQKVVSLEEMMDSLTKRVNASMDVSFRDAAGKGAHKVNVIVTFLAMLELVRQGVVRVEQSSVFGDIRMRSDTVSLPHYE